MFDYNRPKLSDLGNVNIEDYLSEKEKEMRVKDSDIDEEEFLSSYEPKADYDDAIMSARNIETTVIDLQGTLAYMKSLIAAKFNEESEHDLFLEQSNGDEMLRPMRKQASTI